MSPGRVSLAMGNSGPGLEAKAQILVLPYLMWNYKGITQISNDTRKNECVDTLGVP